MSGWIRLGRGTVLEGHNKIYNNTSIIDTLIGRGSYLARDCVLNNGLIGRFCSIAPKVECIYGRHPTSLYVSTHPAFFSLQKQAGFTFTEKQCFEEIKLTKDGRSFVIGNDVWIGHSVKIIEGVTINSGSIVAAGSVVITDIPSYEVWGGVPAKKLYDRFPQDIKLKLEAVQWWDKEFSELAANSIYFQDVNKFIAAEI